MGFKVKFSQQAVDDMDDIIGYLSHELYNPQAAERFYRTINQKLTLLEENPYIYPLHNDERLREKGFRFVVIGNYLMFFLADDDNSVVNIARIVYGGRNLSKLF